MVHEKMHMMMLVRMINDDEDRLQPGYCYSYRLDTQNRMRKIAQAWSTQKLLATCSSQRITCFLTLDLPTCKRQATFKWSSPGKR